MCVADLARIEAVVWNLVPRRDEGSSAEMEVLSTQMECDEKIMSAQLSSGKNDLATKAEAMNLQQT